MRASLHSVSTIIRGSVSTSLSDRIDVVTGVLPRYQLTVPRLCGPCDMTQVRVRELPVLTIMSEAPVILALASANIRT